MKKQLRKLLRKVKSRQTLRNKLFKVKKYSPKINKPKSKRNLVLNTSLNNSKSNNQSKKMEMISFKQLDQINIQSLITLL